jgi:hypothetical protein
MEQVKQAFGKSKPINAKDWKEANAAKHVLARERFYK